MYSMIWDEKKKNQIKFESKVILILENGLQFYLN